MRFRLFALAVVGLLTSQLSIDESRAADDLPAAASAGIRKAVDFYRRLAVHGGYVYYYSVDLKRRFGEGEASPDQIWVQPPGTPTVGLALVAAFHATGERDYLVAATDAAESLMYGQLESGGWQNAVDFNPRGDHVSLYRNGKGRGKNNSTLDDGITQGAIRLLIAVDQAHEFKNKDTRKSLAVALPALLAAQYPNGAFPQVWTGPVPPQPIVKANFPDYDYRTEGKIKEYWNMYTLNDQLAGNVARCLQSAYEVYKDEKYLQALKKLGDFLVLAQLPEPQPAWAQQYNFQMQPIWARRFEPAAVTGNESQDVLETLLLIHRVTGDAKYLQPIPAALAYLKKSFLPDGRLARYYEMKTNRPLYMSRKGDNYSLTYNDADLPSHYGWKGASRLDSIAKQLADARANPKPAATEVPLAELESRVRQVLSQLDDGGRWVSTFAGEPLYGQPKFAAGTQYISSAVFSANVELLSEYVTRTKK